MRAIILAALLIAGPAYAGCLDRDIMAGYLRDRGMPLFAWGLTSDGNMHELFLSDAGDFVVVETTPLQCSKIVSALDKAGGRLWQPPSRNKMLQPPPVNSGDPAWVRQQPQGLAHRNARACIAGRGR